MKKLTTEIFKARSSIKHNHFYNYDLVEYVNNYTKILIVCPIHGKFWQKPSSHLSGQKCFMCSINNKKLTINGFKQKANIKHNHRYTYDSVVYINNYTKIKIVCSDHGVFEQQPDHHLRGQGCPVCTNNKKKENSYLINNLTIEEEPIEVDGQIQCRCAYCKEYFTPTRVQLKHRVESLLSENSGERRLYCSDNCKNSCPIYKQHKHLRGIKPYTSRPDQPELRQLVLKRDNFTCQRCGSSEDLHCHHITGVEINPTESADIDNCITLCYTCHSRVHNEKGCQYNNMKRQPCVV